MYHRLAAVHHAAKADAYASTMLRTKAAGHRARAEWHGRRQRFGSAPRGTELYNAQQLSENLSDATTGELFVDPVFVSSGHTFERKAIVDWLSIHPTCPKTRMPITSVLVTNHHARSMVEEFVTAYATREGDEWAEIRSACAYRETRRQERPPELAEEVLSEGDAVAYIRERGMRDYEEYGPDAFPDHYIQSDFIDRATGTTRRQLDERYDHWTSNG